MNEKIIGDLSAQVRKLAERGKQLIADEDLRKNVDEITSKTKNTIRKHPVKSVIIGLAAGYLLGKIFKSDG